MIGSGWANQCGKEIFTLGWVGCEQPQVVDVPNVVKSGRSSYYFPAENVQQKHNDDFLLVIAQSIFQIID